MTRTGSAHPSSGSGGAPDGDHDASRAGTRARLALAVAALAVAGTLASAAIRGTSESTPGAIQLGRVPAAAVPPVREGLHLVRSRPVELLDPAGTASATTSGSFDGRSTSRARGATATVPGPDSSVGGTTTGSTSAPPATSVGSSGSAPTTPTLPGVTVPKASSPPTTLVSPGTVPTVTLPPATIPQTTLPSVTAPTLPVPTTVALPQLPFLDSSGPGSG